MLTPNTLLNGRYRIEKLIGQGGMGAVYKAHAEHLQLTVAVKEATVTDTGLLAAFSKEAQRLARLRHPALPRVIDHFVEGYGHYLVMEFIEGEDLGDKLQARGQPFSVDYVVALGDQLLQVLDYLHGQQPAIIHRDIKPQNLKVMPNGFLILLDFGLAKGGLTQQNTYGSRSLFGFSAGYAPPEQMNALGTDQRSDLYSVAATLWTLLTAQRAIDAQVREQAAKHGVPDPMRPANELNPQVPPLVAQALTNALALNPNQRPNSATQMRQQLQAEAERKRRSQQQAQDARRQAELERLRREAEAARRQAEVANRQAEREKQQRQAAERRQAELERQQRAAARQPRTVRPVTPPPVTAPLTSTTATHDQKTSHPTNDTTSSIAPLFPINSLDHLRLLWWTLVTPQQLKAYREQYGEKAERPVSKWLVSTLIWLPFLLSTLALGLETLPRGTETVPPTIILSIILIAWLLTGVFGDREYSQAGVESKVGLGVGLAVGLGVGLAVVLSVVLGVESKVGWSVARRGGLAVGLWVGLALALGVGLAGGVAGGLAGGVAAGLVALLAPGVTGGLAGAVEKSLKTGRPSWFARGAFGLLVTAYLYLVWFCFLGGWQMFAP